MTTMPPDEMPEELYHDLQDSNEVAGAIMFIESCLADLLSQRFAINDRSRQQFFEYVGRDVQNSTEVSTGISSGIHNSHRRVCWLLVNVLGIDESVWETGCQGLVVPERCGQSQSGLSHGLGCLEEFGN